MFIRDRAKITAQLNAALATSQDDLALVLIQKKNALDEDLKALEADFVEADKDAEEAKSQLLEIKGEIASGGEASADVVITAARAAFEDEGAKAVVLLINSPGGSPVQAGIINDELRRLKAEGAQNTAKVGKSPRKQLEDIARTKTPDLTAADLEAAVRTIAGSARSMGVDVEGLEV